MQAMETARRRLLIVGATGRIGSAVWKGLGGEYDIIGTSRHAAPADAARGLYRVDVGGTPEALARLASGTDTIFAVAAMGHEAEFDDIAHMNLRGAYNVYEAARRAGVRRVIFASTNHVYDGYRDREAMVTADMPTAPGGLYGASKVYGEVLGRVYSHRYGLSVIALRIGNFPDNDRPTESSVDRWISARDMCGLVRRCIEAEALPYAVLNAVSENDRRWMDLSGARDLVGYVPLDDGSETLSRLPPAEPRHLRRRIPSLEAADPAPSRAGGRRRVVLVGEGACAGDALREHLSGRYDLVDEMEIREGGQPRALSEAIRGADSIVYLVPRMPGGEFEELMQGVMRGAYHVCEAARLAGVRRLVMITDWRVHEGHRGRGRLVAADAPPFPTRSSGAAHVWCEALAYAYHLRTGLSVVVARCGEPTPSDRPSPGREDVWISQAAFADLVGNSIEAEGVSFHRLNAVAPGPSAWLCADSARAIGRATLGPA